MAESVHALTAFLHSHLLPAVWAKKKPENRQTKMDCFSHLSFKDFFLSSCQKTLVLVQTGRFIEGGLELFLRIYQSALGTG